MVNNIARIAYNVVMVQRKKVLFLKRKRMKSARLWPLPKRVCMMSKGRTVRKAKRMRRKALAIGILPRASIWATEMMMSGRVKAASGKTETMPRMKASERVLTELMLPKNLDEVRREMKSWVPSPFLK